MPKKTAFITGITGQDGAYLAEFLLGKNYTVHGLVRWDCVAGTERLEELGVRDRVQLHYGDVNDAANIIGLIKTIWPDEIYNLAALSHVKVSFETPASTLALNTAGILNILEAVMILDMIGKTRVYQASSSEMFGSSPAPQNEQTPFHPCSPYGVAKLAAYWLVKTYRDSYGVHASNGILFNHESPLRGEDFVTRKIVKAVTAIEAGECRPLELGNLDSLRDWGYARDYVRGMWMMLQKDMPGDYVLATGEAHSVREFVEKAFTHCGIHIEWSDAGLDETGRDSRNGRVLVKVNKELFRPKEVNHLLGDCTKARAELGWQPEINFDTLVSDMMNAERRIIWQERSAWKMTG